tara:strand:+ start:436 stop:609 length:174 start_codon:yes stop_codon:yes gene_type:complete
MKGNISNNIEGKFSVVKKIGNPIPISLLSLKNFNSSKMFIINIREEKIKVTYANLIK